MPADMDRVKGAAALEPGRKSIPDIKRGDPEISTPSVQEDQVQQPALHSRTPSSQEPIYQGVGVGHHHLQGQSGTIQLVDSLGSRSDPLGASSSALAKRKRNELEFRKRRVTSSTGLEPADNDDDELRDEDLMNEDDELDGRRGNEGNDLDDMEEDSNRYQPLKRRASTGTLLSQARASSVKHIPGPFATDSQKSGLHLHQKSTYPEAPLVGIIRHENHHLRSPSPDPRDDDLAGHYSHVSGHVGLSQIRGSPPDSVSSTSSLGGVQHNHAMDAETRRHRHLSGGSGMDRTTGSLSSPTSATTPTGTGSTGKTTVHFSEVVECAQLLQAKYGNRCKDHPWGCVEITEERHLELTIKMYLDWAGLVASGRLTMDELPDLPEFRSIRPLAGGTLRRMASTPLTSSLLNAPTGTVATTEKIITNTVDSSLTGRLRGSDEAYSTVSSSGRAFFGPYRSPSSSPPSRQHSHIYQQQQQQQREKGPVSEEGSLTPALDTLRRPVTSPPQGASSPVSEADMSDEDDLIGGDHKSAIGNHSNVGGDEGEDEDEDDDDDEDEEEEEIDVSHYALSPWAAVKSVSSRQSRQSGGNGGLGIEKQLRIPIPDHVDVTTNAPSDDDVRRNELRKEGDSTVMAMDTELVVSEIGEIAEAECIGTSGDDKNNKDTNIMSINNNTSCVDATVQVLDSMIIGRVETGVINDGEKKEETTGDAVKVLDMDQGMDRKLDQVREVGQVMDVDDSDMIES
ncbi:hypothetical protein BGX28_005392 [Mortierella sp. GBA30]|nr:hypothetical protein BGX28_005392 [Mortierella sp. GBA30]